LTLSHWHRPLRLRQDELLEYSAQGEEMCGGQDETTVASAADGQTERERAKTVGSGVSVDPIDLSKPGTGSNDTE
jgi:hypothetical protein